VFFYIVQPLFCYSNFSTVAPACSHFIIPFHICFLSTEHRSINLPYLLACFGVTQYNLRHNLAKCKQSYTPYNSLNAITENLTTDMFLTHYDISTMPRWVVVAQNVTRLHETLEVSFPVVIYHRPTQTAIHAVLHIITLISRHSSPFRQHYVNMSVRAKLSLRLIRAHTMKTYRK